MFSVENSSRIQGIRPEICHDLKFFRGKRVLSLEFFRANVF